MIAIAAAAVAEAFVDGDGGSDGGRPVSPEAPTVRSRAGTVDRLALVAEIHVPRPVGIAVAAGSVWVVNGLDGTVVRIDPARGVVTGTFDLEITPSRLLAGPAGPWAVDERAGVALLLDAATARPTRRITLGSSALALALFGDDAWVATLSPPSVLRLDTGSDSLVARVDVPDPRAVSASGSAVWVSGAGPAVYRIDAATGRIVARIPLADATGDLLATAGDAWVAHAVSPAISRIDARTSRVAARLELGLGSAPLFLAWDGDALWVESLTHLLRVDPASNRVVAALPLTLGRRPGPEPIAVGGLAAGAGAVWVADTYGDAVLRVDPGTGPT